MDGKLEKWSGEGGRVKNKEIVQEKLSKQNSWKEKPKEKKIFHKMGHILILNQCSISLVPLVLRKN